ncbi:MAG: hypothetical protein HN377_03460 [Alphaproteobacteria bacterium]|nr:hypothetical protein [Alphaproteobacteria bacterium]MBT7944292.1 hypothetical protein [Alphaproteobacteria bacterium]
MTRLLVSDKYPHHHDLSAVLESIRGEIHKGSHRMTHDGNPETRHLLGAVLECNDKVMELLNRAGKMIEDLGPVSAGNLGAPVVVPLRPVDPARRRMPYC